MLKLFIAYSNLQIVVCYRARREIFFIVLLLVVVFFRVRFTRNLERQEENFIFILNECKILQRPFLIFTFAI